MWGSSSPSYSHVGVYTVLYIVSAWYIAFYMCFHTGFGTTWRVPHAEQEMLTLPEHLISPLCFRGFMLFLFYFPILSYVRTFEFMDAVFGFWLPGLDWPFDDDFVRWWIVVVRIGICTQYFHLMGHNPVILLGLKKLIDCNSTQMCVKNRLKESSNCCN